VGGPEAVRRKGGRQAGAAAGPEIGHQVAEAAIAVTVLLSDVGQGPPFDEDRTHGFVLALQDLGGMQEEVLAGGVVHGVASGSCHPFFVAP